MNLFALEFIILNERKLLSYDIFRIIKYPIIITYASMQELHIV